MYVADAVEALSWELSLVSAKKYSYEVGLFDHPPGWQVSVLPGFGVPVSVGRLDERGPSGGLEVR